MVRRESRLDEARSPLPGAASAASAAASAAAREAAARARGSERRAEAGRQVRDPERAGTGAQIPGRADPVDRALVVQRLGHQEMGALEHALGDPERDPVDEVALPELERRGRRLLQAGEVREVAAERLPALGLGLAGGRPAAPERRFRGREDERGRVRGRAEAQRDPDYVAPARRGRAEPVDPGRQQHDREPGEDEERDPEDGEASAREPALRVDRVVDGLLEVGEALAVAAAVGLDALAELAQPVLAAREHRVDHLGYGRLEPRQRNARVPESELEVRDVLVAQAAPELALGRDRRRLVATAADQVEQRGRELVRARLRLLRDERWDKSGLGLGRRRLLVLAVVARRPLTPVEPPHASDEQERRRLSEDEQDQDRAPRMALGAVDPLAVVLVRALRSGFLGDDLR